MYKMLSDPARLVDEMLDGLLAPYPSRLGRADELEAPSGADVLGISDREKEEPIDG